MAVTILDYTASMPDNATGGVPPVVIPQVPTLLQAADLGVFIPQVSAIPADGTVVLSADIGVQQVLSPFNNALQVHIYRDGKEIFNTQLGTQSVGATSPYFYNISFRAVDQNVPIGFHVYQLNLAAIISVAGVSTVNLVGPVTFSALAYL